MKQRLAISMVFDLATLAVNDGWTKAEDQQGPVIIRGPATPIDRQQSFPSGQEAPRRAAKKQRGHDKANWRRLLCACGSDGGCSERLDPLVCCGGARHYPNGTAHTHCHFNAVASIHPGEATEPTCQDPDSMA